MLYDDGRIGCSDTNLVVPADGVIHLESPVQRIYTLGEFFDEWGQPLGPNQVGSATGPVTAMYNGKRYEASPRDIPLHAHAHIQLEVGTPLVAPESFTFADGLYRPATILGRVV